MAYGYAMIIIKTRGARYFSTGRNLIHDPSNQNLSSKNQAPLMISMAAARWLIFLLDDCPKGKIASFGLWFFFLGYGIRLFFIWRRSFFFLVVGLSRSRGQIPKVSNWPGSSRCDWRWVSPSPCCWFSPDFWLVESPFMMVKDACLFARPQFLVVTVYVYIYI